MSINLLKMQVKYCLNEINEDKGDKLLMKKKKREKSTFNIINLDTNKLNKFLAEADRYNDNLNYFKNQNKYKELSSNVLEIIKK